MLLDRLTEYSKSGVTPMHMPGHKRNTALLGDALPYHIDITEIDGFDDLHDASGILKETADLAARLYGCNRAFPLVNGATGGILAAVYSVCRPGDTVVMARNCHKSVYNAVLINNLKPVYLMPGTDAASGIAESVTPAAVAGAVESHPEAKLVIITSPTYEGVVSDLRGICGAAHRHGVPVLVDAAHGAHLGFSEFFPPNAAAGGADIVVASLHKTLPALTQCALALLNSNLIDKARFHAALSVFQTSSPSYVLLSSIDRCLRLLRDDGARLFETYVEKLKAFDMRAGALNKLKVICHGTDTLSGHPGFFAFDPGKIVIGTRDTALNGSALMTLLRSKYRLELEMAAADYAVAMTSVCDGADAFARLAEALCEIDREAGMLSEGVIYPVLGSLPQQAMTPGGAADLEGELLPLEKAAGRISLEYVWAYPPGIPYLVPGEVIGSDIVRLMGDLSVSGVALRSTRGTLPSVRCAKSDRTYL